MVETSTPADVAELPPPPTNPLHDAAADQAPSRRFTPAKRCCATPAGMSRA